ncbi:flippase-like domain-containing protein [bacterium]|nr:flippase-like domain-containing protein [bacterium]
MNANLRKAWIATAVAIILYAVYAFRADLGDWGGNGLSWPWVALALAAALGNYLLRAARWRWLLARGGDPLPWGVAAATFLAGFFYTFTPGKVGELAKAAHLYDLTGIPARRSLAAVWLERSSDVAGVVALAVPLVAFWLPGPAVAWALLGVALGFATMLLLTRLPALFLPLAGRLLPAADDAARAAFGKALRRQSGPLPAAGLAAVGWVAWALEGVSCWACLRALGLSGGFWVAAQAYALSMLAGAASLIPGGLGATEFSLEALLRAVAGLAAADAARAVLLTRLATLWWGFPIGVAALAWVLWATKRRQAPRRSPPPTG